MTGPSAPRIRVPARTQWAAWQRHIGRYPTPAAEVAAARRGIDTCVEFGDWATLQHRAVIGAGGPVFEETVQPDLDLRDVIDTTWLNMRLHTDTGTVRRGHWRTAILGALRRHILTLARHALPAEHADRAAEQIGIIELPDPNPDDPGPQRFYLRAAVHADTVTTWEEMAARSPFGPWIATTIGDTHSGSFRDDVAAAGLPVVSCRTCGVALTDAHPAWPGTWVDLGEYGPQCTGTCPDRWGLSRPHSPQARAPLGTTS